MPITDLILCMLISFIVGSLVAYLMLIGEIYQSKDVITKINEENTELRREIHEFKNKKEGE